MGAAFTLSPPGKEVTITDGRGNPRTVDLPTADDFIKYTEMMSALGISWNDTFDAYAQAYIERSRVPRRGAARRDIKRAYRSAILEMMGVEERGGTYTRSQMSDEEAYEALQHIYLLTPPDQGTLSSIWYGARGVDAASVSSLDSEIIVRKNTFAGEPLEKDRRLDHVDVSNGLIYEVKSGQSWLSPDEKKQRDDLLKIIDFGSIEISGRGIVPVQMLVYVFLHPAGAKANLSILTERMIDGDPLSIEVYNKRGKKRLIIKDTVEDEGVAALKLWLESP